MTTGKADVSGIINTVPFDNVLSTVGLDFKISCSVVLYCLAIEKRVSFRFTICFIGCGISFLLAFKSIKELCELGIFSTSPILIPS